MEFTQSRTSAAKAVVDRLLRATNDHDIDALVGCFAPDYVNETPAHPDRGFTGAEQVRRNWTQIFAAVPDLVVGVVGVAQVGANGEARASADDEGVVWTEWQMSGTRGDGTPHLMRGVIIFTVRNDQIIGARFFLEPVQASSGTVAAAVASQIAGRG